MSLLHVLRDATGDKALPYWITIDALGLRVDRIRLNQAIILAGISGWLKLKGNPPESLAITASGIELLEQGAP
jgi:hypothetical protein